ncbi:MAG: hypothetical protein BHW12_04245 [Coprobacillus sp. 28_7]|nr:MAG: hypothetical protein BHW12_04245 [Coprobacillus sp. 28_7]
MKLKLKNLKYSFRCLKEVIKKHPAFLICGIIEIICLVITKLIPINVVGKIVSSFKEGQTFKEILYIILTNVIVLMYFYITFLYFLKRDQYDYILGWQQFYALVFCFWCRIFRTKKKNKVVVINFTYKQKSGFSG